MDRRRDRHAGNGTGVALTTDQMGTARWLAAGGRGGVAVPIAPHTSGVIARLGELPKSPSITCGSRLDVWARSSSDRRRYAGGTRARGPLAIVDVFVTSRRTRMHQRLQMNAMRVPVTPARHRPVALSFNELYGARRRRVARDALSGVTYRRSSRNAAQDVFVVVHRRLADFEGRAAITTWLFAITRKVAARHLLALRRSRRRERSSPETGGRRRSIRGCREPKPR